MPQTVRAAGNRLRRKIHLSHLMLTTNLKRARIFYTLKLFFFLLSVILASWFLKILICGQYDSTVSYLVNDSMANPISAEACISCTFLWFITPSCGLLYQLVIWLPSKVRWLNNNSYQCWYCARLLTNFIKFSPKSGYYYLHCTDLKKEGFEKGVTQPVRDWDLI